MGYMLVIQKLQQLARYKFYILFITSYSGTTLYSDLFTKFNSGSNSCKKSFSLVFSAQQRNPVHYVISAGRRQLLQYSP